MLLLSKYKTVIFAFLWVVWTAVTWNVSSSLTDREHLSSQLKQQEKIIQLTESNDELRLLISKQELAKSEIQKEVLKDAWKEIANELATNSIYQSCRNSDRVRGGLQRKLDSQ